MLMSSLNHMRQADNLTQQLPILGYNIKVSLFVSLPFVLTAAK